MFAWVGETAVVFVSSVVAIVMIANCTEIMYPSFPSHKGSVSVGQTFANCIR